MNANTLMKDESPGYAISQAPGRPLYEDPLNPDEPWDVEVTTTCRGLARLALVAAETGARFQREAIGYDPMAWLLAPRRLFDDGIAVQSALKRDHCLRAVLLHRLSLGLDAEPGQIDALLCDTPDDPDNVFWDGEGTGGEPARQSRRRQRLYSAMIVLARGGELVHLFHASVAPSATVVRERIRARFGATAAGQANVQMGVDLSCPTTSEMLPPAFRAMIECGRGVRWSAMTGLDVTVEHRIPS